MRKTMIELEEFKIDMLPDRVTICIDVDRIESIKEIYDPSSRVVTYRGVVMHSGQEHKVSESDLVRIRSLLELEMD